MQLTGKHAGGSRARGDHVTRDVDGAPTPTPGAASSPSSRREASEAAGAMAAEGGPRPAAPGTRGGVMAGRGSGGIEVSSGVRRHSPSCVPGSAEARAPGAPSRRDAGSGSPGDPGAHGVTMGTKEGAWHLSRRSGDLGLYVNGSRRTSERLSVSLCGGQACLALIAKSRGRMEG